MKFTKFMRLAKLQIIFFAGSFFVINVVQAMLVEPNREAGHIVVQNFGEAKAVVAPRPRSMSAFARLTRMLSNLHVTKQKPRSMSVDSGGDAKPVVVVITPTPELIADVQARLDGSSPKALCRSINNILTDHEFVAKYALTAELLGLVLRGISGLNVNMQDDGGFAGLHFAHQYGQIDVLRTFIFAGALVNIQNRKQQTPLFTQQFFVNFETVQALLAHGADLTLLDADRRRATEVAPPDIAALLRPIELQQRARLKSTQETLRLRVMVEDLIAMIIAYGIH